MPQWGPTGQMGPEMFARMYPNATASGSPMNYGAWYVTLQHSLMLV